MQWEMFQLIRQQWAIKKELCKQRMKRFYTMVFVLVGGTAMTWERESSHHSKSTR
jgi:hypothetical protein